MAQEVVNKLKAQVEDLETKLAQPHALEHVLHKVQLCLRTIQEIGLYQDFVHMLQCKVRPHKFMGSPD